MALIFRPVRLSSDGNDPAWGVVAGRDFHDRTHQSGDQRSAYGQGCSLAAMLIITAAPRHLCICCLECFHALSSGDPGDDAHLVRQEPRLQDACPPVISTRPYRWRACDTLSGAQVDLSGASAKLASVKPFSLSLFATRSFGVK